MTDEDKTMGEICDELQAFGIQAYIDSNGRVWTLKYEGEIDTTKWEQIDRGYNLIGDPYGERS